VRPWLIPWLFPLAILLLAIGFLISPWVGLAVVVVILAVTARAWRAHLRAGGKLPDYPRVRGFFPGGIESTRRWGRRQRR
jgi:hypothetical protein